MAHTVLITLPSTSGLPIDDVVNTWAIGYGEITEARGDAIADAFATFYGTMSNWIANTVSRGEFTSLKIYDTTNPEPRLPIYQNVIVLEPHGGNPLPREVALCTSFRAEYVSGSSNARRRGRVYFGPLTDDAIGDTGRPSELLLTALSNATETLTNDLAAIDDAVVGLSVYSRVNELAYPVIAGWVDNEFDTQRRRGLRATSRNTWSV